MIVNTIETAIKENLASLNIGHSFIAAPSEAVPSLTHSLVSTSSSSSSSSSLVEETLALTEIQMLQEFKKEEALYRVGRSLHTWGDGKFHLLEEPIDMPGCHLSNLIYVCYIHNHTVYRNNVI